MCLEMKQKNNDHKKIVLISFAKYTLKEVGYGRIEFI